jgi:hypothetical protein
MQAEDVSEQLTTETILKLQRAGKEIGRLPLKLKN